MGIQKSVCFRSSFPFTQLHALQVPWRIVTVRKTATSPILKLIESSFQLAFPMFLVFAAFIIRPESSQDEDRPPVTLVLNKIDKASERRWAGSPGERNQLQRSSGLEALGFVGNWIKCWQVLFSWVWEFSRLQKPIGDHTKGCIVGQCDFFGQSADAFALGRVFSRHGVMR